MGKDCILSDDGMKKVCAALIKAHPPLKCIHLSGNELTAKGAKSVAKLVSTLNKTIEIFDVEGNELTSFGVKRIVQEFDSTSLKKIQLNYNECGRIGATALMEFNQKVPNLECIELDGNMFPEESADKLIETFGK